MAISTPGIGSGLDVNSIISQLMQLEQQPILQLQQKQAVYTSQISGVGQIKGALSSLQSAVDKLADFSDLGLLNASSADTAIFTASADNTAAAGTFDIQVVSLAQAEKQGSAGFADADTTTVGTAGDKLTVTLGSGSFQVEIGGKTLTEIAAALNDAPDNAGVTASVIESDIVAGTEYHLTLTSNETGTAGAMTLAFEDSGGGAIPDPFSMAVLAGHAAQDAEILVDGAYTITRSSNTISDAIQGVTLQLQDTSASAVTLDVARDTADVRNAVSGFVAAYNSLQTTLDGLSQGLLSGDSVPRLVDRQINSVLNTAASGLSGSLSNLSEVGVSFTKEGTLSFDSTKLDAAMQADQGAVEELFSHDDQGFGFRLSALLGSMLGADGLIDARTDGLNSRVDDVEGSIAALQRRLVTTEERYRAQFTALDALVANTTATGDFLTQQLAGLQNLLPGNNN